MKQNVTFNLKFVFLNIIFILLLISFQNCSNQNSKKTNSSYGGGEPYQGTDPVPKQFAVNTGHCSDEGAFYLIIKIEEESFYRLTRENCVDSNVIIDPGSLDWIKEGISFKYGEQNFELRSPVPDY